MKKETQGWIVVAGFVAVIAGVWLLWPRGGSEAAGRRLTASAAEMPAAPDLEFPGQPGRVAVPLPEGNDVLPEGAMAGHRVWQAADAAALAALEAQARAAGLTVRSSIPALGMLHVSGDEATLSALEPEDASTNFLYPMQLPPHPDPADLSIAGLAAFNERALEFLGLSEVPANWGDGVVVAVLDTGIGQHPALAQAQIEQGPGNGAIDANGHGTAMTGLLAGRDAYARGLAPSARFLNLPVLDAAGQGTTFEVARGIVEAVDRGAQVINLSAGSSYDSAVLREAADYAAARGVVVVAAAGNEGREAVRYPAGYENVVGVTSIDGANRRPGFANTGEAVDIAAPGVGVYSTWQDEGYVSISGSSAAAPFVSGAIAMLMSETPGLSALEAAELVMEHANEVGPPGRDNFFGAGVLNLERLMRRNEAGISDLAVVTPHVAIEEADGLQAPVYLSLENRGNEPLSQTRLDLEVNGITYTYTVGDLGVGASRGVRLPVPLSDLERESGVTVKMKAWHPGHSDDANPENDSIEMMIWIGAGGDQK